MRRMRMRYCVILVSRCLFLCTRNLGQCSCRHAPRHTYHTTHHAYDVSANDTARAIHSVEARNPPSDSFLLLVPGTEIMYQCAKSSPGTCRRSPGPSCNSWELTRSHSLEGVWARSIVFMYRYKDPEAGGRKEVKGGEPVISPGQPLALTTSLSGRFLLEPSGRPVAVARAVSQH